MQTEDINIAIMIIYNKIIELAVCGFLLFFVEKILIYFSNLAQKQFSYKFV